MVLPLADGWGNQQLRSEPVRFLNGSLIAKEV